MSAWRVVFIICLAAGCGKSGGPPKIGVVPIKGTVKLDGKPVAGADVAFVSTSSPTSFIGKTNDAGVYELQGAAGGATAIQGTYKVTISRRVKADGSPLPADEPPMSPANLGSVEQMPPKYARPDLSQLTATVGAEGGTYNFEDLTSN
jgi:hypothetical protein